eukprot:CAMPEP_0174268018 /NCGR_PEP_ID=MMETSP0439-20130205/35846_1 /TAXON_ID=0 /ORGANISM="Stereomyxa ramosa, Strain Chinc5" /LENGTH=930 /DNA_ID=CAMNT_0015355923 /DNA_START=48 /DNA_END=2840 /DNA_ORIENTATION=+
MQYVFNGIQRPERESSAQTSSSFVEKMMRWKDDLVDCLKSVEERVQHKAKASTSTAEVALGKVAPSIVLEVVDDKQPPTQEPTTGSETDVKNSVCGDLLSVSDDWTEQLNSKEIEQTMNQIASLSSQLLKEKIVKEFNSQNERTEGPPKEELKSFMEFYTNFRSRALRKRVERLRASMREEVATEIVNNACRDALTSMVLEKSDHFSGSAEGRNHRVMVPSVSLEAAENISSSFSALVSKCLLEIDEMEREVLQEKTIADYEELMLKLRAMEIAENPIKRRKIGRNHPAQAPTPLTTKRTLQRTVLTLSELCVNKCVDCAQFLPPLEGCLPEELLHKIIAALIEAETAKLSSGNEVILKNLVDSSMFSLSFSDCTKITNLMCDFVSHKCSSLKRLNLKSCVGITSDHAISRIVAANPRLEIIELQGCYAVGDVTVNTIKQHCALLKTLDLSGCGRVTDHSLRALPLCCPLLEKLKLRKCPQVTDASFFNIGGAKELSVIDLNGCRVSDTALHKLTGCKKLKWLKVSGEGITDEGIIDLINSGNTQLSGLELMACNRVTDESINFLVKYCPDLVHLSLPRCKSISSSLFKSFSSNMSENCNAKSLDLTSSGRQHLVDKPLCDLQHLDLSHCFNIDDLVVVKMAELSSGLQSLNLSACEEITDLCVVEIAQRKYELNSLNLSKCMKISDASVVELVRSSGNTLRSIHLDNCPLLTDRALKAIAKHCPNLLELSVSCCEELTDNGMLDLSTGCPNMEKLDVSELPNLTSRSLESISRFHSLKTLSLAYSKELGNDTIELIIKGCRELTSLDLSYCNNILSMQDFFRLLVLLPNLRALSLKGNSHLKNEVVAHPALRVLDVSWSSAGNELLLHINYDNCPALSSIDLAWCDVSSLAVHTLASNCPSIKTFNLRGTKLSYDALRFLSNSGKIVYK